MTFTARCLFCEVDRASRMFKVPTGTAFVCDLCLDLGRLDALWRCDACNERLTDAVHKGNGLLCRYCAGILRNLPPECCFV